MKGNEHKLVQDLIPNYIDGLTSLETTQYIEEHLTSCEDCKKILEDMKTKIQDENHTNLNDKKVKYAKKVNRKLRFLKLLIGIILIALIWLVIDFDRKAMILKSLQSKRKSIYRYG